MGAGGTRGGYRGTCADVVDMSAGMRAMSVDARADTPPDDDALVDMTRQPRVPLGSAETVVRTGPAPVGPKLFVAQLWRKCGGRDCRHRGRDDGGASRAPGAQLPSAGLLRCIPSRDSRPRPFAPDRLVRSRRLRLPRVHHGSVGRRRRPGTARGGGPALHRAQPSPARRVSRRPRGAGFQARDPSPGGRRRSPRRKQGRRRRGVHGLRQDARLRPPDGGDPGARRVPLPQAPGGRCRRLSHARARQANLRRRRSVSRHPTRRRSAHAPRRRHGRLRGRARLRREWRGGARRNPR